jgi:hypothetical protein
MLRAGAVRAEGTAASGAAEGLAKAEGEAEKPVGADGARKEESAAGMPINGIVAFGDDNSTRSTTEAAAVTAVKRRTATRRNDLISSL